MLAAADDAGLAADTDSQVEQVVGSKTTAEQGSDERTAADYPSGLVVQQDRLQQALGGTGDDADLPAVGGRADTVVNA